MAGTPLLWILVAAMLAAALALLLPRLLVRGAGDGASAPPARRTAAALAVGLPVAAVALYLALGNPDAAREERAFSGSLAQLTPETAPKLRAELARHLAASPGDGRGWAVLGRLELALERPAEAAAALEKAVAASSKVAADPGVWCDYAEAIGLAQGGTLAGKPMALVAKALELDPANARALELAGSGAYEAGDYAGAARAWRQLLGLLQEGSRQHRELAAAIARAERFTLSPAAPAR